jgi:hypothetical protein
LNLIGLYYQRVVHNPTWFRDQNGLSLMFFNVPGENSAFDENDPVRGNRRGSANTETCSSTSMAGTYEAKAGGVS